MSDKVTVIVTNFKTKHLVQKCISSFRRFYPKTRLMLIDNGSNDESTEYLFKRRGPYTDVLLNGQNYRHGPALRQGIALTRTPYFFTLDSDCEVTKRGFLERMLKWFQANGNLYATGWLRWVNYNGVAAAKRPSDISAFTAYIHPSAAMYRKSGYMMLPAFDDHGAPCRMNMRGAKKARFAVASFPIEQYIKHLKAGTRRMWSGRWNPGDKELPVEWDAKKRYPI